MNTTAAKRFLSVTLCLSLIAVTTPYVVNGKMTGGFAYVAYPAKYDDSVVKTFITNQDGVVYVKDLGKDTASVAKAMTEFNPDNSWTALK